MPFSDQVNVKIELTLYHVLVVSCRGKKSFMQEKLKFHAEEKAETIAEALIIGRVNVGMNVLIGEEEIGKDG